MASRRPLINTTSNFLPLDGSASDPRYDVGPTGDYATLADIDAGILKNGQQAWDANEASMNDRLKIYQGTDYTNVGADWITAEALIGSAASGTNNTILDNTTGTFITDLTIDPTTQVITVTRSDAPSPVAGGVTSLSSETNTGVALNWVQSIEGAFTFVIVRTDGVTTIPQSDRAALFNAFGASLLPSDFPANSGRTTPFLTTEVRNIQYGGHELTFPVGTTLTDLAGQVRINPGSNHITFPRTATPNGIHVLGADLPLTGRINFEGGTDIEIIENDATNTFTWNYTGTGGGGGGGNAREHEAWDHTSAYTAGDIVDHNGGIYQALQNIPVPSGTPQAFRDLSFVRFVEQPDENGVARIWAHIRFTQAESVNPLVQESITYNFGGAQRVLRVQPTHINFNPGTARSVALGANASNWFINTTDFTNNANVAPTNAAERTNLFGFNVEPGGSFPTGGRLFTNQQILVIRGPLEGNSVPGSDALRWRRINEIVEVNQGNDILADHLDEIEIDGVAYRARFRGIHNTSTAYAFGDLVTSNGNSWYRVRNQGGVPAAGAVVNSPVSLFAFVRLVGDTTNSYFHVRMPSSLNPLTFDFTASYAIFGNSYTITFDGADAVDVNRAAITGNVTEFYIPFGDITGDTGTANFQLESNISSPTLTRGTGTPNLTPELDSGPTGNWERVGGLGILDPERYHFSAGSIKDWQEVEGEDVFGKVVDVFSYRTTPSNLTISSNGDVTTTGLPEAVVTALTSNPIGRVASRTEDASLFFISEVVSSTTTSLVVRPQYLKTDTTEFVGADARAAIAGVTVGTSNSMFASLTVLDLDNNEATGMLIAGTNPSYNGVTVSRLDVANGFVVFDFASNADANAFMTAATGSATGGRVSHSIDLTVGSNTAQTSAGNLVFRPDDDGSTNTEVVMESLHFTFDTLYAALGRPDTTTAAFTIQIGHEGVATELAGGTNVTLDLSGNTVTVNSTSVQRPFGTGAEDIAPWAAGNEPPPISGLPVDITDQEFAATTVTFTGGGEQLLTLTFTSETLRNRFLTTTIGNTTGSRPTYSVSLSFGMNEATTVAGHTVFAPVAGSNTQAYIEIFGPASNFNNFITAWGVTTGDTGTITTGHQGIATSIIPPSAATLDGNALRIPDPTIEQVSLSTTTPVDIPANSLVVTQNAVRGRQRIADPDFNPRLGNEGFERSQVTGGPAITPTNTEGIYEAHFEITTPGDVPTVVFDELYFFESELVFSTLHRRAYATSVVNDLLDWSVDTGGGHLILVARIGQTLPLPTMAQSTDVIQLSGTDGSGRSQTFTFPASAIQRFGTDANPANHRNLSVPASALIDPTTNEPFRELDEFAGRNYGTDIDVLSSSPAINFTVQGRNINRNASNTLFTGAPYIGQDGDTWGWFYEDMIVGPGISVEQLNTAFTDDSTFKLYGSEVRQIIYHRVGPNTLTDILSPLTTGTELDVAQLTTPTASRLVIDDQFQQISLQAAIDILNGQPQDNEVVVGSTLHPVTNEISFIRRRIPTTFEVTTGAELDALPGIINGDSIFINSAADIDLPSDTGGTFASLTADLSPAANTNDDNWGAVPRNVVTDDPDTGFFIRKGTTPATYTNIFMSINYPAATTADEVNNRYASVRAGGVDIHVGIFANYRFLPDGTPGSTAGGTPGADVDPTDVNAVGAALVEAINNIPLEGNTDGTGGAEETLTTNNRDSGAVSDVEITRNCTATYDAANDRLVLTHARRVATGYIALQSFTTRLVLAGDLVLRNDGTPPPDDTFVESKFYDRAKGTTWYRRDQQATAADAIVRTTL